MPEEIINSDAIAMPVSMLMLTEEQTAEYLGASLPTVRRWRKKGIGPDYFRVGDILRYIRDALREKEPG